jgi:hypothetical protein
VGGVERVGRMVGAAVVDLSATGLVVAILFICCFFLALTVALFFLGGERAALAAAAMLFLVLRGAMASVGAWGGVVADWIFGPLT